MKVIQAYKKEGKAWSYIKPKKVLNDPLVLVFGNRYLLEKEELISDIRKEFPYAHIVFGSTSGEIIDNHVNDGTIVVTAMEFEKSKFLIKTANILDYGKDSAALGVALIEQIPKEGLKHLFVLSEGSFVNGSSLIKGIESDKKGSVSLTGGMCGDGARFEKTVASYQQNPKEGEVVLIGFYGETIDISFASRGGWIPFGPERIITKSEGNELFEIDGQPALNLYKNYLGDKANQLPKASLLYPLNVKEQGKEKPVVRTVLQIDKERQSMILAGDVPEGSRVQLMMAGIEGIANGAREAASLAMKERSSKPEVALVVSCIGRKLVMDQRIEEEIEQVQEVIGEDVPLIGFYSYGEMAPFHGSTSCELHNQTMTLTLISE